MRLNIFYHQPVHTRMFGVSEAGPATSLGRSAVEAKVRTALREQLEARTAAPNGRPTASRIAMVCKGGGEGLRDVQRGRATWGGGINNVVKFTAQPARRMIM